MVVASGNAFDLCSWDSDELVDPEEFLKRAPQDAEATQVLELAFSKLSPAKKASLLEPSSHEKDGPPLPAAAAQEVLPGQDAWVPPKEQLISAECAKERAEELEQLLQKRREAWTASQPTSETNASCTHCGEAAGVLKCGTCKAAQYCSKACQKAAWPAHKLKCKARRCVQICILSDFA
mmetsp:Transcript_9023/g.20056  ORF Transcript_9023/g.20056 Transcript_9023/m.20056 type:complete len:179 (-) Transcript_9023:902-1438(-)